MLRIAVDLTPILPGGENGGAKIMVIELIRQMAKLAPQNKFILLTTERNHDELATLDANNVQRFCIAMPPPEASISKRKLFVNWMNVAVTNIRKYTITQKLFPQYIKIKLASIYQRFYYKFQLNTHKLLKDITTDLLFCPFTAPFYYEPGIPVVSVIYDLQYKHYPAFFSREEYAQRENHFQNACKFANYLICISDYVKETVFNHSKMPLSPEQVITVHIALSQRLSKISDAGIFRYLKRFELEPDQFILYPANFWEHKNHKMLFTAYAMYRARYATAKLKLVCTGTPNENMAKLQSAAKQMGLQDCIILPGYLTHDEFSALIGACRAVIFPSLYEGFGMPDLEAMTLGKPVICSNVTSLPEVAGEAALLFDPRKPEQIVEAIHRIETDQHLIERLKALGFKQVHKFGNETTMALQYLEILHKAASEVKVLPALLGVYNDGWTSDRVTLTFGADDRPRYLEMDLQAASGLEQFVMVKCGNEKAKIWHLKPAQSLSISQTLPLVRGSIDLLIEPCFKPKAFGSGDDERILGVFCKSCRIIYPTGVMELYVQDTQGLDFQQATENLEMQAKESNNQEQVFKT